MYILSPEVLPIGYEGLIGKVHLIMIIIIMMIIIVTIIIITIMIMVVR